MTEPITLPLVHAHRVKIHRIVNIVKLSPTPPPLIPTIMWYYCVHLQCSPQNTLRALGEQFPLIFKWMELLDFDVVINSTPDTPSHYTLRKFWGDRKQHLFCYSIQTQIWMG